MRTIIVQSRLFLECYEYEILQLVTLKESYLSSFYFLRQDEVRGRLVILLERFRFLNSRCKKRSLGATCRYLINLGAIDANTIW